MRFYATMMATAAFLAGGESLAAGAKSRVSAVTSITDPIVVSSGRLLRAAKSYSTDTEERGFISQFVDDVTKMGSVTFWVNTGKTDDYVKDVLHIDKTLTGAALKAHPNYKIFEEFVEKMDARKVDAWINKDTLTAEVWTILGLDKLTKQELKESDALTTYIRYATMLDDEIWHYKRASFEPEISSATELSVKVRIWANADRPSWYVLEMMGKNAKHGNPNYEYYQLFQKLIKAKKQRLVN
ncbi:putative secreted RxLR effector protein [Phytophthora cinnamomi]|uniref:putative secreted RxLR effector protein n=1 Tax=Phytophthora cinnamomi TaxID=4785 RepID=UPI0035597B02|nr:putative secreted RxLR effector protein [Phytophthora cinnamomi]